MGFDLKSNSVVLDNNDFKALKESESGKHYFADRIPNFGVLNFGYIEALKTREISLAEVGITSPISLVSIYNFASGSVDDQTNFYLKRGTQQIAWLQFKLHEMPFAFPPGAIITPDLTIGVHPKKSSSSVVIYWQPVNIIHSYTYLENS